MAKRIKQYIFLANITPVAKGFCLLPRINMVYLLSGHGITLLMFVGLITLPSPSSKQLLTLTGRIQVISA